MREHRGYGQIDIDHRKFLELSVRSTTVSNADEFLELVNTDVRNLLEHEMSICGIAGVSAKGSYVHKVLHQNYPLSYFDDLLQSEGSVDSPLMARWRKTREPVFFQCGRDEALYPTRWVSVFNKHDLRNTIGHGVLDVQGTMSTYFIFSRIRGELADRHILLMKLIVPHLHDAIVRALQTIADCTDFAGAVHALLSERQRAILCWLHDGKTNSEIARILNMTENNVNYHIDRILWKLSVRNRAQAVAKAVELGLLEISSERFGDHKIGGRK